jgi:low temperature requirement protein LtrA
VAVRVLGLLVYDWVAWTDPSQHAAVRRFSLVSIGGLVAVLVGGILGGQAQYVWWSLAIALDLGAAAIGATAEGWNIHPEHFTERHGLFVIIALGESVIVAALSLTGGKWPLTQVVAAVLSVAIAGAMWWSYFTRNKLELDTALEAVDGAERAKLARDAFSIIHFPMLLGVIAFAASVEQAIGHATDPLGFAGRLLLAASVVLFTGSMALALARAGRPVSMARKVIPLVTAAIVIALSAVSAVVSLGVVLVGLILLGAGEPVTRRHHGQARSASAHA